MTDQASNLRRTARTEVLALVSASCTSGIFLTLAASNFGRGSALLGSLDVAAAMTWALATTIYARRMLRKIPCPDATAT
jgi:hypothetical protein